MLTKTEYETLWKNTFGKITRLQLPGYEDYKIICTYYENYLKLFLSKKIRYILIAEAAPFNGAYIYNYDLPCGLNTPYFTAVAKAFNIEGETKLNTINAKRILSELANKGVLILDLFPFAIKITTQLRKKLISSGFLKDFWDETVYSIQTQIRELCTKHKIALYHTWDLCLIAPTTISTHIVKSYSSLIVSPCAGGKHNITTFRKTHPHSLRKSDYKKVAVSKAGFPNATLIKIAFDL